MNKIFFISAILTAVCFSRESKSAKWEEVRALAKGKDTEIATKTHSYLKKYSAIQLTELIKTIPAKEIADKKIKKMTIDTLLEVFLSSIARENKMEHIFFDQKVHKSLQRLANYPQFLFNLQKKAKISAEKLEKYRTKKPSTHNLAYCKVADGVVSIGENEKATPITISHVDKVAAYCLNPDGSLCATITANGEIFVWKKNKNGFNSSKYFDSAIVNAKTIAFGGTEKCLLITDNTNTCWMIGGYYELKPRTYAVLTLLKSHLYGITLPAEQQGKKSWLEKKCKKLNTKLKDLEYPAEITKTKKDNTTLIFKLEPKKVAQ